VTKDTAVGDLIFSDVYGPLQTESIGGARYILTFIDGASRFTSTHLIVKKSEVTAEWKKYKAHFENQHNCKIKKLFTDNGAEYVNRTLGHLLEESDIQHATIAPYNPISNRIAERMNKTLLNCVRMLLKQSNLCDEMWG
jgi:transposase InsO family protein